MYRLGVAHTENACARQDHGPQSTFNSSALSSEKPDRTTVPRACSIVLPPLQRSQTGPQYPEHVLQFCPLFREGGQDHRTQSKFYSSAPSSEKPEGSSVPMEQRCNNRCGTTTWKYAKYTPLHFLCRNQNENEIQYQQGHW